MTSIEKYNKLIELEVNEIKAWITTILGDNRFKNYFILECNFIEKIEEIDEVEWQKHLDEKNKLII